MVSVLIFSGADTKLSKNGAYFSVQPATFERISQIALLTGPFAESLTVNWIACELGEGNLTFCNDGKSRPGFQQGNSFREDTSDKARYIFICKIKHLYIVDVPTLYLQSQVHDKRGGIDFSI